MPDKKRKNEYLIETQQAWKKVCMIEKSMHDRKKHAWKKSMHGKKVCIIEKGMHDRKKHT